MKKTVLSIAITTALFLPSAAMAADDEITIRMLQLDETDQRAVMQKIQLPQLIQETERTRNQTNNDGIGEQHQERNMVQEQLMEDNQSEMGNYEDMQGMQPSRESSMGNR